MAIVVCPHCGLESADDEFCEYCGRSVETVQSNRLALTNGWGRGNLACDVIQSPQLLSLDESFNGVREIEQPVSILPNDQGGCECYFPIGKISLQTFLEEKGSLSFDFIHRLLVKISSIFEQIHARQKVVGGVHLTDFWMDEDDIESLVYRVVRPFLSEGDVSSQSGSYDYFAPELYNKEPITYSSDVMLIGSMFISFFERTIGGITDMQRLRYQAHQLLVTRPDYPVVLHSWVGKSTRILPEDRYRSVVEQMKEFSRLLSMSEQGEKVESFLLGGITDDGVDKRERSPNPDDANEDRYLIKEGHGKAFMLVADGITTAMYGKGSLAAEIVCAVADDIWQERADSMESKDDVEKFFADFIRAANERIVQNSDSFADQQSKISPSDLMGSTCVAAVALYDRVYTISIGDSRAYRWSPTAGLQLLHADQNVMNASLAKGFDWQDVRDQEDRTSLISYLGMADTSIRPFRPKEIDIQMRETVIAKGDLLFLCSDGVTDYLYPLGYQNDFWKVDHTIDQLIRQHVIEERQQNDLHPLLQDIVKIANENGGGDNITAVVLKVH